MQKAISFRNDKSTSHSTPENEFQRKLKKESEKELAGRVSREKSLSNRASVKLPVLPKSNFHEKGK